MPKAPKLDPAEKDAVYLEKFLPMVNAYSTDTATRHKLQTLVSASPALEDSLMYAISRGAITTIAPENASDDSVASYSPYKKAVNFPTTLLDTPNMAAFTLGHEVGHAVDRAMNGWHIGDKFAPGVDQMVTDPDGPSGPRNYTTLIQAAIEDNRRNEAEAHISGFNALRSKLAKEMDPLGTGQEKPTLRQLYDAAPNYMRDFVDVKGKAPNLTLSMKEGLTLETDGSLSMDKNTQTGRQNIDMMKVYFADKLPSSLGPNGTLNYAHSVMPTLLKYVHATERNEHALPQVSLKRAGDPREHYIVEFNNLGFSLNPGLLNVPKSNAVQTTIGFDEAYPDLHCSKKMGLTVTHIQQRQTESLLMQASAALKADPNLLSPEQKRSPAFDVLCAQTAYEATLKGARSIERVVRDPNNHEQLMVFDEKDLTSSTARWARFTPDMSKGAMAMDYEQKVFEQTAAPAFEHYNRTHQQKPKEQDAGCVTM